MIRTAVLALLLAIASAPAMAQKSSGPSASSLIDATRPQSILSIARAFGQAELSKDSDGDPLITGTIKGKKYYVLFYGCDKNVNCRQIEFRGVLKPGGGFRDSRLNEWNLKYRYGKAYLDTSGDIIVNYLVHMGGGVTRTNLESSFEWFTQMLNEFHNFMQ